MKHSIYLVIVAMALLLPQVSHADPIDSNQALRNAQTFLQEKGIAIHVQGMRRTQSKNTPAEKQAPYYVFNIGEDKGFVIASGDDRTPAVLGYSDKGSMNLDSLPENVRNWLKFYEEQISRLDKLANNNKANVHRATTSRTPVKPLLSTTWGQDAPYNNSCPIAKGTNERCVTGCVATAMAQVMYYHRKNSINKLMMDIPSYSYNLETYLVSRFEKGSLINWDNILDKYDDENNNYSQEQADAVANLMAYCGSSVEMSYGLTESGSSNEEAMIALIKYFDYDEEICIKERCDFSDDMWESMIYDELKKGNPLIYGASGHSFVVDGHDGDGYVHINWGWNGDENGFYLLSASAEGDDEYTMNGWNSHQEAIFGAVPNGAFSRLTTENISLVGGYIIKGISSLTSIPVSFSLKVANQTKATCSFEQAIGLYRNGNLLSITKKLDNIDGLPVYATKEQRVSFELESPLLQGVYFLVPLSKSVDDEKWRRNVGYDQIVSMTIDGDDAKLTVGPPNEETGIISFADDGTKGVCVERWDTNDDGELSMEEAAAVKNFSVTLNTHITSFDELRFFKGITNIHNHQFSECYFLSSVMIPESVKAIYNCAFNSCNLRQIIIPKSVETVRGNSLSANNNLERIIVEEGNPKLDSRNDCNAVIETATNTLVAGCKNTVIPEGVKAIGEEAFIKRKGLGDFNVPKSVESIGDKAYAYDEFKSIAIPANIIRISGSAFAACDNLASIKVDVNNQKYESPDGSNAIMEKETGKLVMGCKATTIPQGTTAIGDSAFHSCRLLSSIEIPEGVKEIGDESFSKCNNMTFVCLPSTMTNIGKNAFKYCSSIKSIVVKSENPATICSNTFENQESITLYVPSGCLEKYKNAPYWSEFKNIVEGGISQDEIIHFADINTLKVCLNNWDTDGNGVITKNEAEAVEGLKCAFKGNKDIVSFDELQYFTGVIFIGNDDFRGALNLESITVPNTVYFIDDYAFSGCINLKKINLPRMIESIGNHAFSNCQNLENIKLPANLMRLEKYSFSNCKKLTSIDLPTGLTALEDNTFYGCESLETVTMDEYVQTIGNNVFEGCSNLAAITIPDAVTSIGNKAFYGCSKLNAITIPEAVASIGEKAFYGSGIGSLFIPKGVNSIGNGIAEYCTNLSSIKVDEDNETYDSRDDCNAIIKTANCELILGCSNTTIPNTVKAISKYAFRNCINLKSLSIPASVSSIGDNYSSPFYGCENLVSIKVDENNEVFDSRDNCNAIISKKDNVLKFGCQTSIIPNSVKKIEAYAFSDCVNLKSIVIPEGVTSIGTSAFQNCSNLTSVKLSSNMKKIEQGTFDNCSSLSNLIIPENIESIDFAFAGCTSLNYISFPSTVKSFASVEEWDVRSIFQSCYNLNTVVIRTPIPPGIDFETFYNYSHATLYVPKGCRETYMEADNWQRFDQIEEFTGIRGDINQDGNVSIIDVMALVSSILGIEGQTIPLEFADINGDGAASVVDVTAVVNIILNIE